MLVEVSGAKTAAGGGEGVFAGGETGDGEAAFRIGCSGCDHAIVFFSKGAHGGAGHRSAGERIHHAAGNLKRGGRLRVRRNGLEQQGESRGKGEAAGGCSWRGDLQYKRVAGAGRKRYRLPLKVQRGHGVGIVKGKIAWRGQGKDVISAGRELLQ